MQHAIVAPSPMLDLPLDIYPAKGLCFVSFKSAKRTSGVEGCVLTAAVDESLAAISREEVATLHIRIGLLFTAHETEVAHNITQCGAVVFCASRATVSMPDPGT